MKTTYNHIDSFFEDIFSAGAGKRGSENLFEPPADVYESEIEIIIELELPGVDKSDTKITYSEDGSLYVGGIKNFRKFDNRLKRQYSDRKFGKFHRTFQLPSMIYSDRIAAEFHDGILKISIPKYVKIGQPERFVDIK